MQAATSSKMLTSHTKLKNKFTVLISSNLNLKHYKAIPEKLLISIKIKTLKKKKILLWWTCQMKWNTLLMKIDLLSNLIKTKTNSIRMKIIIISLILMDRFRMNFNIREIISTNWKNSLCILVFITSKMNRIILIK